MIHLRRTTLSSLGKNMTLSEREVNKLIHERKRIVKRGSDPARQSLIWSRCFSIWKTYQKQVHSETPIDFIKTLNSFILSEEFRFLGGLTFKHKIPDRLDDSSVFYCFSLSNDNPKHILFKRRLRNNLRPG